MKTGAPELIKSLNEGFQYRFLGVPAIEQVWSSLLSDYNKVMAANQFALRVLTYFMYTCRDRGATLKVGGTD